MAMAMPDKAKKVADLTVEELIQLIEMVLTRVIDRERLIIPKSDNDDTRTLQEVMESIEQNRFTPPPDAKSGLQMLIDERRRREEY
jgi:hypothetical protein